MKDFVLKLLPWKVKYILDFKDIKKRYPKLIGSNMDYSDYIFRDNFLGNHNHHAFLADKCAVRNYVIDRGLSHTLTKLYGVWTNAADIDFDTLPLGFALKCNHSCGTNIICTDKNSLDVEETRKKLNFWLTQKHPLAFEQHYHKISPKIFAEELIPCQSDGSFPADYKIHCANGKPVFIQVCFERTKNSAGLRVIYSPTWVNLHYVIEDDHYSDAEISKPSHLKEMLEYASILSKGLKYARIDFYDTPERVIFGEVTLTPMGGWLSYFKQEALDLMGKEIRKQNK